MRPRAIAGAVLAVAVAAAIDANITHWSRPVSGDAAQAVPVAPPAAAGTPAAGPWAALLPDGLGPLDAPHHDYPALDVAVATGTPLTAIHAGTVSYVGGGCGLGVRIHLAGHPGVTAKVCHASRRLVAEGATVAAGDLLALAGSTGNSTGPHAHLEIRAGGALRCPGPLLTAISAGGPVPDPVSLPTQGCVS